MQKKDLALAFLIATIWGGNFIVIKLGLADMPPMLLAALRYVFTALPAVAFIRPPKLEWRYTVAYGLTIGFGQFACLFYAMTIGMPAGLSSIILQTQAFFTMFFAFFLLGERLELRQLVGLAVSIAGLFLIGGIKGPSGLPPVPLPALFLTLAAAAFWGLSNIVVRLAAKRVAAKGERLNTLSLVAWSSLVPPLPLLALGLLMNSPQELWQATMSMNRVAIFAIVYLAYLGTIFGSSKWSGLLSRYPAGMVAPFSLLIPLTSLVLARVILQEQLTPLQYLGSLVVIVGLCIINFRGALRPRTV
jgi:O-acetylserine/cysteine efflux transporter